MSEALIEALTAASIISISFTIIVLAIWSNRLDSAKLRAREVKTRKLLCDMLSHSQRRQLVCSGYVSVTGSAGGRYVISKHGAVERIDDETPRRELYCFVPEDSYHLTLGDILLARIIALQIDEPAAMAVATRLS